MKRTKCLLLLVSLCVLLMGPGCVGGFYGYTVGPYYTDYYQYPATQFVPGPCGTNYRVDGTFVGNPIYPTGGYFIPTSPYCW